MSITKGAKQSVLALALMAMALAFACGGGGDATPQDTPVSEEPGTAIATQEATPVGSPMEPPMESMEESGDGGLKAILATIDLGVGPNRVSFLLTTPRSLVTVPEASIESYYRDDPSSPDAIRERAQATFHPWPYGTRGNYVADFNLDGQGLWELKVTVEDEGKSLSTIIPLQVEETSYTPSLGTQPPLTPNKTVQEVSDSSELSSSSMPDLDLYQHSIEEVVDNGRPALVVFASPAFCTSPTCGPQVETVEGIKDEYKQDVDFVHVEIYDNPQAIQGDLNRGEYAPAVGTWGLSEIEDYLNESWVFILDREGRVTRKYEGFASADELEQGWQR